MTTQAIVHIGVDVSKKHLDLSPFDKGPARIPYDKQGIRRLLKRIDALDAHPIVTYEASGGYERELLLQLGKAGIDNARVNSGQVRHFTRSQGIGAKNDRIDARMIARFATVRHDDGKLFLNAPTDEARWELRELLARRSQIKEMITQEQQRLDPSPGKAIATDIRQHIKQLKARLEKVQAAIKEWGKAHPEFDGFRERLATVNGFGIQSILMLIAFLPELGKVSDKRASALVGVAPYERQSGETSYKAKIYGGRIELRNTLYMAALAATRSNEVLRSFYLRLQERGKPKKLALIAVLRKMVVLANRVAKDPDFKPAAG